MISFYFDENLGETVAEQLRARGVEVVMAKDVGMVQKDDDTEHLPYATARQLVLVTFDKPFATRTLARDDFYGLVCLTMLDQTNIGRQFDILYTVAQTFDTARNVGHVFFFN